MSDASPPIRASTCSCGPARKSCRACRAGRPASSAANATVCTSRKPSSRRISGVKPHRPGWCIPATFRSAEVLQAMAQAAILAMPSRMIEGFPLTAIEGMACGLALVATRQGGLPRGGGRGGFVSSRSAMTRRSPRPCSSSAGRSASRERLTQLGWERVRTLRAFRCRDRAGTPCGRPCTECWSASSGSTADDMRRMKR